MKAPFVLLASLCAVTALPHNTTGLDKATLILTDGTTVTIPKSELDSQLKGLSLSRPIDRPKHLQSNPRSIINKPFQKRGSDAQLIIPLPDQSFLDWDIPMSTVTFANEADATIAIAAGETIANSITVGESFSATVEGFLGVTTNINYQETETSALTGTVTMTIPKNKWGVIVSNPLTERKSGYVFSGQPGSGQFDHFQADSFTPQSFSLNGGTLSWVKGAVTTCLGDKYPLPKCNGEGTLE